MEGMTNAVISLCEKHIVDFRIRNGQAVAKYCPFCKGGNNGDTETFAIGLYNGAYNCQRGSCGKTGSFKDLCDFFGEYYSNEKALAVPIYNKQKKYVKPDPSIIQPITEEIMNYFTLRHISENTVKDFKIGADAEGNIVFPFYRNQELVFCKFRKPGKYVKGNGPKEWAVKNTEPILLNMDTCSYHQPLFITEGEIDAMSLYEAGCKNVVSVPSGCNNLDFITLCWDWLERFQQIVLFGDNDEPGREMVSTLTKRLGEDRCLLAPEYPMFIYNGKDYGRPCKDANEILIAYGPEVLKQLIDACEPAPVKGVLNLADVQFVDPTTQPHVYTRIPKLDDAIGGLYEGGLTIFTGKRGEGKSTVSGTLLLSAIQQEEKVCAYSGELSSSKFLEWIMMQATESQYIGTKEDPKSKKLFTVIDPEIQDRIRKWIDGKFYLFDNTATFDEPELDAILRVFTLCARRYGCKIFLVDNLMTITQGTEDEFKLQGRVASKLKEFAVRFKAHVILVSHPRKVKQGETIQNDDVSGNSAVTNLADNVIVVEKPNLRIQKNRNFGTLGFIECNYNPANRRIYQADFGDKIRFGWDHTGIKIPANRADVMPEFAIQSGTLTMPPCPF